MTNAKDTTSLRVVHPVCCGLDVHKEVIVATLIMEKDDGIIFSQTEEFGTFVDDLEDLRDWLKEHGCEVVAIESTGIYWRCVHNVLEEHVDVVLVNARHVKNVPGRKTDIEDSRWLADLLRHGLVRGSFIPEKLVRQWRDLTRMRRKNREAYGDYKRRIHKLLESANIKLGSIVSDLFGETGLNLLALLMSDTQIRLEDVEACARGNLRKKVHELYRSIQGFWEPHHRFQLKTLMTILETIEKANTDIDARLKELMKEHEDLIKDMTEVPGIQELSAWYVLSEIGVDLNAFPSATALCSWAGLCPGNNQSAGKRRSGRSPVRKHHLKTILIEVAWAAVRTKGTYYRDKYWRLRHRLGPKKAIVAIAHRILKALYFIIKERRKYKELGEEYLSQKNKRNKLYKLKRAAKEFGFDLVPAQTA